MQFLTHTRATFLATLATLSFVTADLRAEESSACKSAALKAVTAYFSDGNAPEALKFVARDAERKNKGKGSALQMFRHPPDQQLRLREIHFFAAADLEDLRKRFSDDMWEPSRVPAWITDRLGCLIVLSGANEKQALAVFVLQQIGDKAQIVYTDDN